MQQMERDNMNDEKASLGQHKERKLPQDSRIDEKLEQPVPPFLNEGPEMVRDKHC